MIEKITKGIVDLKYRFIVKSMLAKANLETAKEKVNEFNNDNRGIAVIEVILILVIVMALGVVFRENIKKLFDSIFKQINNSGKKIIKDF